MKILHVIPSLAECRGGASKAAIDMVAALRSIGVDVELACTNDDGAGVLDVPLDTLTEFQGVPVRFFARYSPQGQGRLQHAIREYAYSASFRRWLRANLREYSLIHVHALFSFTSTYAMRLARRRGIPYFAHPIGSLDHWSLQQSAARKQIYLNLFEKKNLQSAARVHFTAKSERDQALQAVALRRPLIVPLGLDLPTLIPTARQSFAASLGISESSKIILFLGRLHPKKGIDLLLRALKQQGDTAFHLAIAGDGDATYLAELKSLIQRLGLTEKVTFTGYLGGQDKCVALQGADLFALTSHAENFGIAVLEALAHGTPVLLCRGVALAHQVQEYGLGWVAEPTVESVSTALHNWTNDRGGEANNLDDDAVISTISVSASDCRDYVKAHHNWQSLAQQLLSAYQQTISLHNN